MRRTSGGSSDTLGVDAPGSSITCPRSTFFRAQGYALVDEELEIGLRSIAVPVRTRSGKVVAAINSGVHAARVQRKQMLVGFLPVLREGADRLSIAHG